ncbi:MAG: N-acetylglucosamine-6-phosphate deacetylase [Verrucomicrobiales bacterium]|nr:N-acetylglucosamine-6-phosphate deacetylase [Verrucomicrobiales bacterium]
MNPESSRRSEGSVTARHFWTGKPVRLGWRDGRFTAMHEVRQASGPAFLAPTLFDPQINGFAGVDFQQNALEESDLVRSVRVLRQTGCTRFLLTLITDDWTALTTRLAHLHALRQAHPELRDAIAGWHLEGPFLSTEPGFRGAHNPAMMLDPVPRRIEELRRAAGDDLLLLTLAPERQGAVEAIARATSLGIRVSLGHTNATAAQLAAARDAGATGFTHLGNACPQTLDRHDNLLWRVLDTPGLQISLIADGRHVAPPLFRLIHRLRPAGTVLHTTDAMAAAAAPPGRYTVGWLKLDVGPDRITRQPGHTNFAGSALTPVEMVFRASAMLGGSWQQAWLAGSRHATGWLGLATGFSIGARADFCLVTVDDAGRLRGLRTFAGGEEGAQLDEDAIGLDAFQPGGIVEDTD